MISSELLVGATGYWFDIIALASGERMVRLRRQVGAGPNSVAALVPTTLFLPQVSTQGGPFSGYARIITRQGTVIGEVGGRPQAEAGPNFMADTKSDKFGFDRRNPGIARPHRRRTCRSQMVRLLRCRRHHDDYHGLRCAHPATFPAQSGGRHRARAQGRRIRSLLSAHRRHPIRSVARRRSPGALAKAGWHACVARARLFRSMELGDLIHDLTRTLMRRFASRRARPSAAGRT